MIMLIHGLAGAAMDMLLIIHIITGTIIMIVIMADITMVTTGAEATEIITKDITVTTMPVIGDADLLLLQNRADLLPDPKDQSGRMELQDPTVLWICLLRGQ